MDPDKNLNLPVLIYGAKEKCPACHHFEPEWEELSRQLQGQVRLVKFSCNSQKPPPAPLKKYFTWFPSIILAGPKSYFRCFTHDDQVNEDEFSDDYVIKAQKFNAKETPQGYEFAEQPNTAKNVIDWLKKTAPSVWYYDEPTPPRRYAQAFNSL